MKLLCAILTTLQVFSLTCFAAGPLHYFSDSVQSKKQDCQGGNCGNPLFITPYLKQGEAAKARQEAQVHGISSLESYSGFFTVNQTYNSNIFFWYFPAQSGNPSAPLLVWLQGGPGGSSMFAVFNEAGPFRLDKDLKLSYNPYTWNQNYSMIFIDNPVGTGFSFTDSDDGYCTNKQCYGNGLYETITQFYQLFPDQSKNDLYITGESYGGKYVPMFAYTINKYNEILKTQYFRSRSMMELKQKHPFAQSVPLKGISVGDGWCDPVNMIGAYGGLMYNFGLVDSNQQSTVDNYVSSMKTAIKQGDYRTAYLAWDKMLNGDLYPYPTFWKNATGGTDYFNILRVSSPAQFGYFSQFLTQPDQRKAIHVGSTTFGPGSKVEKYLIPDVMDTMKPELTVVMTNYKVLIYNGQLDVIIGGPLTESFLPKVEWPGRNEYLNATRNVWHFNGSIAGYVRQVRSFTQAIVRGAGHILPYDQPDRALEMLTNFIEDRPF
eukprot:gb/GECG01011885.1/.p1 GENE.gb/GECG01011885.1/~~gb/GECG01011885.1/.p1  ORF type:complete len:490 (+),score=48.11 gb/GECG01011885.1/:1-1470(+)